MKLVSKSYQELTADEVYEILSLRTAVFVVEQNCPYQDPDGNDQRATHVWLEDEDGIAAYLRVLEAGVTFPEASIGRVISMRRRQGLGTKIVKEGIRIAREKYGADVIAIEAQTYARKLYENVGFVQTSEEFLEDGIPHIQMKYTFEGEKE